MLGLQIVCCKAAFPPISFRCSEQAKVKKKEKINIGNTKYRNADGEQLFRSPQSDFGRAMQRAQLLASNHID
jgi:hypothetical protein